jgi:hypothetical protein
MQVARVIDPEALRRKRREEREKRLRPFMHVVDREPFTPCGDLGPAARC